MGLNSDLCNASTVLYQLSYQAKWELVTVWVNNYYKPIDDGYRSTMFIHESHVFELRVEMKKL